MNCACFYNCQYDQYGSTFASYHDENCIISVGTKKCTLLPLDDQPLQPPSPQQQPRRETVKRRKSTTVSLLKMKKRKQKIEQMIRRNQRLSHLIQWNGYIVNSLLQAAIDSSNSHNNNVPPTTTTKSSTNSCNNNINSTNQNHSHIDNTTNYTATKEGSIEMLPSSRTPESSFQESIDMDKSLTQDPFTSGSVKVDVIPSPTRMPNVCKIVIRSPSSRLTSPHHTFAPENLYPSNVMYHTTPTSYNYYPSPVQYSTPTYYTQDQITAGSFACNHTISRTTGNGPGVNSFHSHH